MRSTITTRTPYEQARDDYRDALNAAQHATTPDERAEAQARMDFTREVWGAACRLAGIC